VTASQAVVPAMGVAACSTRGVPAGDGRTVAPGSEAFVGVGDGSESAVTVSEVEVGEAVAVVGWSEACIVSVGGISVDVDVKDFEGDIHIRIKESISRKIATISLKRS